MIKKSLAVVMGIIAVGMIAGCEWEEVTDDDAQSSKNSSTNTTAVVTTNADGTVTTNYVSTTTTNTVTVTNTVTTTNTTGTSTNGSSTNSSSTATRVTNEAVGSGVSGQSSYSGAFAHGNVKAGTVTINAGGLYSFVDNGDGTLSGPAGKTGRIVYETGAWSINLMGSDIGTGTAITATYMYYP